jgi:hypothetical protein
MWTPTENVGTAVSADRSTISGSARLPIDAKPGKASLSICTNDVDANACAKATITVLQPTLEAHPRDLTPGATTKLSGEGWCCGSVTVRAGSTQWGTGTVDADGRLRAGATVPGGTAPGGHEVTVCSARQRCATIRLTIQAPPTPTTSTEPAIPTTLTTPPSTGGRNGGVPHRPPRWPYALGAAGLAGATAALRARRAHLRRQPGHVAAHSEPPRHRLVPPPVTIVVRRGVNRRTILHLRSDP